MEQPVHEDYVQALAKRGFLLKDRIGSGAYGTVYTWQVHKTEYQR